jgi:hypothetical protein
VSVKLDDIDLIKVVKGDEGQGGAESSSHLQEIRTIYGMRIVDRRNIVEIEIPGSSGNLLQDMGCNPVKIAFAGEIMGEKASETIEQIFVKYNSGTPLEFHSDLTVIAEVNKVVIENFGVEEIGGSISRYRYVMTLLEYKEPKEQREEEEEQEAEVSAGVDDIRGQVLDEEGNPAAGKKVKISGPDGETEVTTDENGYYELLDVPEGNYVVTSDEEGYEDLRIEFEVRKGQGSGGEEAG